MVDRLRGVIARLPRKEAAQLEHCTGRKIEQLPANAHPWCVLVCEARMSGRGSAKWAVLRDDNGEWYAQLEAPPAAKAPPAIYSLDHTKFAAMAASWDRYRGDFSPLPANVHPGEVSKVVGPCPGWWTMDKETLGARFLAGRPTGLDGAARVLSESTFLVRLPKGYKARERCGVLVWIDAGETGDLHRPLWEAADASRLIIIGAQKTGNGVVVPERFQFALDAAQTAQEHYLVDPARIYTSGISGGGKIASQMWMCFPDIFRGSLPIVGLDSYEQAPAGAGKAYLPHFAKPPAAIWKMLLPQRMAVLTGDQDFNQSEIHAFAKIYQRDHLDVKVIDIPGMAHELPAPDKFAEAVSWVDRAGAAAADLQAKAAAQLAEARASDGDARREKLMGVTRDFPWTEAAWEAADELLK
jgi:dienelactone hydrolase